MQNQLKQIRNDLRRAMNGVTSTSMREKGIVYKLNFGVALPELKEIAQAYEKDAALAEALWQEDIREFKILATLLYPADSFTSDLAKRWVKEVPYPEIAEQMCINLLKELPYAEQLMFDYLLQASNPNQLIIAFLLAAQLCKAGHQLKTHTTHALLAVGRHTLDQASSMQQPYALIALKQYGRQSAQQAAHVLSLISEYQDNGHPRQEEFFNDLKFEFDYYH